LTGLWPQARLFGLLALLVPLFMGLQYLVQESVPQIEVRFIAPDAQSAAQPPAERVVERVVYVPIEKAEPAPLRQPGTSLSQMAGRNAEQVKVTGMDSAVAVAPPVQAGPLQAGVEQPPAASIAEEVAEPAEELQLHMGVVAMVTPVAAPVVAAAPPGRAVAPARIVTAPVVAEPAPAEEDEAVEAVAEEALPEGPAEAEPVVAEATAPVEQVAEIQVVETIIGSAEPRTRVVSYKVPVHEPAEAAPSEPEQAAAPEAAEEPAGVDEPAATEDESAAVEDEPVGAADEPEAADDEAVAANDAAEAPAWDADEDVMKAEDPADFEAEDVEPAADEVAEAETFDPGEAAVSNVSVTVLATEQGQ
jgi:hypothetical protein